MDVTIAIATYGTAGWISLARERAIPSTEGQAPHVHAHRDNLADARNAALELVTTPWVIHLDADDELTPGYVAAMAAGTADLRAPAVEYVAKDGGGRAARLPRVAGHRHVCEGACMTAGNWLAIGTAARTEVLRDAGGWREWPVYEDWDLFLRAYLAGATLEPIPEAVYRAHVRPDSRNRGPSRELKNQTHYEIVAANGGPWDKAPL